MPVFRRRLMASLRRKKFSARTRRSICSPAHLINPHKRPRIPLTQIRSLSRPPAGRSEESKSAQAGMPVPLMHDAEEDAFGSTAEGGCATQAKTFAGSVHWAGRSIAHEQ